FGMGFLLVRLVMILAGMTKGWRSRVQSFFHPLSQLILDNVFDTLLLKCPCNSHVWVNLRCGRRLEGHGNLVEAFEQRVALELIIEQHASEIGMAGKANAVEVISFALKPVGGGPYRDNAIHLRLLIVQAYFKLEQLPTGNGAHMIDRFQVIQHINAGYATQQVKAE